MQYATPNLARLMATQGLSIDQVAERTGLDRRTIQGILNGTHKPHARSLQALAQGLGVSADELFLDPARLAYRCFDRHTNPLVQEVIETHPALFHNWTDADFDELHSRMGTGGPLTAEGTIAVAQAMNENHEMFEKLRLLAETDDVQIIRTLVDCLYQRRLAAGA